MCSEAAPGNGQARKGKEYRTNRGRMWRRGGLSSNASTTVLPFSPLRVCRDSFLLISEEEGTNTMIGIIKETYPGRSTAIPI